MKEWHVPGVSLAVVRRLPDGKVDETAVMVQWMAQSP